MRHEGGTASAVPPLFSGPSSSRAWVIAAGRDVLTVTDMAVGSTSAETSSEVTAAARGIVPSINRNGRVRGVADILCDGTGRLGALSYVVPSTMSLHRGDAVHVPFGKRELHGVVLGPGDPARATRDVIRVYGRRAAVKEIELAETLAARHFSEFLSVAARLSPRTGRGAEPLQAGTVSVQALPRIAYPKTDDTLTRRFLVRAPLVDPAALAAREAQRLSADRPTAQVLVLCPTVELVEAVLSYFSSGAARVDTKAPTGAWRGFCEGGVQVAVGTRSAALYTASDLAGIIVVEEDHPGHLEATQPYWNARDVAAERARVLDVPLVLIGANPTAAGLGAKVKAILVGTRADWPKIRLVDRDDYSPDERLVPPPLSGALSRAKKAGMPVTVLSQSKKASRRCVRCGLERPCAECTSSTCRHVETTPCTRCGDTAVKMVGWDARRLSVLLGKDVKALPVTKLAELADTRMDATRPLPDGTVPAPAEPMLVVVFDIDAALNAPGFTPEQVASHFLVTAARAAGVGGQVMVLTNEPNHPVLKDLCIARDQMAVAKRVWATAKNGHLPPFGRLVTVRSGQDAQPRTTGWPGTVYGPRRSGKEWEVLVKISDQDLPSLKPYLDRLRRRGKVRISVT